MFILTLWLEGFAQPFGFRFLDRSSAVTAYEGAVSTIASVGMLQVHDDYGQRGVINAHIHAMTLVSVEDDLAAQRDIDALVKRASEPQGVAGLVRP